MNVEDLPDETDSSDEEYVPGGKPEEQVSEVESDGDPEDPLSDPEEDNGKTVSSKGKKRRKRTNQPKKRSRNSQESVEKGAFIFN